MLAAADSERTVPARAGVLAGLAALTLVAAIGVLLAPVVAQDPVVSWPPAGRPARSTVLPLVPYRPLALAAQVPCAALSALDRRTDGGDALRTLPATAGKPGRLSQGLVVAVSHGLVQVTASGRTLVREALPAGGCTYRVLADAGGVRVLRDGAPRGSASVQVPEVSELATDLDGQPAAAGLAVSLHTDARYESTPTALKTGLLVVCAGALLMLLGLAWRWWGGQAMSGASSGASSGRQAPRPRLSVADAVLVAVSAVWVLLAPTNFDDSWYMQMARGANASGSVGNAIYMFNVTENPFVASQYVLQLWGALGGWSLAWMRLVPLAYGLVTWLLLRRYLVAGFGRELGTSRATWALLVAYLLWWLPYGMTLRPEPLIVLLAAATLLLADLARRRRSVGVLASAVATAALAMSVSPSGLVAIAPLVLALPWLWQWLRAQRAAARIAAVALLAAASCSLVLVGFADATLGDVLESAAVHQWYYQTFSWYQEKVHYQTILSFEDSSQWARRAPVVLTIAVLLTVAVDRLRRISSAPRLPNSTAALFTRLRAALLLSSGTGGLATTGGDDPVRRLLVSSAGCSALALALLAPTPTKFVNHFGAAAAAPTVLLAAALLRSPLLAAMQFRWQVGWQVGWHRHRASAIAATAGTALLIGAVSWSFAGPNLWRPYSDRGQPFGNHLSASQDHPDLVGMRPKLGPVQLANPLVWVAVALAAACWIWWRRRRGQDSGLTPDRAVLVAGSTALVVTSLVVFVWAPVRQYPGWSVALSAVRTMQGDPCTLAGYAQVLVDTAAQPVPVESAAITEGGFAAASRRPLPEPVPAPTPGTLVWHDAVNTDVDSDPDTSSLTSPVGLLVTPWFALPPDGGTTLLVPLLGARAAQQVTLEYATTAGPDPAVAGSTSLRPDPAEPRTQWYQAAVALDRLGKQRPSSVRVVVRDWTVTDADSWLAVGQPRLAGWRPLTTVTARQPVYVDQLTAALLPCLDQVGVEHGIARAPQVLVLSDEGFGRGFLDLGFELDRGGTEVPVSRSATAVRMPSRLVPNGPPTLPWGRVERVVYDHPVGLVDLHVETVRRSGWTRLPTLAAKSYHGNSTT
ncbi:MAG: arabinosyltransferase domain-containing protein [Actinomycetota bacterium]|nr:arabinosyltransferase domain-containing protein [Actinomycetota bacterium]